MRFVAFEENGQARLGLRMGDQVAALSQCAPELPPDLAGLIAAGEEALAAARSAAEKANECQLKPLAGLTFFPPLPNPSKIICLGVNYRDHAAEGGNTNLEYPAFFLRGPSSLIGHRAPLIRPRVSETLDYEAELLAVVGRRARHVAEADALGVIFGYSAFNDATVREYQRKTSQWTIGKNFDGTGPFGPEVVTADELPPGAAGLRIRSRLNGEVMQDSNTDNMMVTVAGAVAILSECMTLEPGDLIAMGTPAGVGYARKPPVWMRDGDVCEIEIERIGILSNPIQNEKPAS